MVTSMTGENYYNNKWDEDINSALGKRKKSLMMVVLSY